jgi:hypothetical protein
MSDSKKTFDAVAMMRSIRDELSAQIAGMTLEEELKWLASQELQDPVLRRLGDRVAPTSRCNGRCCASSLIAGSLGRLDEGERGGSG